MAAKKKPSKAKPAKKARVPAKPARRAAPRPAPKARAPAKRTAPKSAKKSAPPARKAASDQARRMAAFSQKVLKEEEAPVAVRTFNEARAGIERSKELDVRSGEVTPLEEPETPAARPPRRPAPEAETGPEDEDIDAEIEKDLAEMDVPPPRAQPKIEPLTGELATPKRRNPFEEQFQVGASAKKGKKGAPPTKEDLGKIELRMQRGSKDEAIAHASPDYLQRSFNKAAQKGKVAATSAQKGAEEHKPDEFEVAMDKGRRRMDAALSDFGDVEIAQQTRRGSKKVGKLDTDEEDEGAQ